MAIIQDNIVSAVNNSGEIDHFKVILSLSQTIMSAFDLLIFFVVYVDVTDVDGPIQISVLASAIERKRFRIRICQISTCTNPLNCLQYYTGLTGVITTFNYDQATSLSRSVPQYFVSNFLLFEVDYGIRNSHISCLKFLVF